MTVVARAYIGTSGWSYDAWTDFYGDTPKARRLEHCARIFSGLEINASFYRLQREKTLRDWADRTPEGFRFTLKGHRFVTHNKKLLEPDETIPVSRENARPLGDKLAAVVWQVPAMLKKDLDRLEAFARALDGWRATRHALELRHRSWFDDETAALLARHDLAVCLSDAPDFPMWDRVTTDLVYVRLHGHTRKYASSYASGSLDRWADRVRGWLDEGCDVHVYFDNDAEGAAPENAQDLLRRLEG